MEDMIPQKQNCRISHGNLSQTNHPNFCNNAAMGSHFFVKDKLVSKLVHATRAVKLNSVLEFTDLTLADLVASLESRKGKLRTQIHMYMFKTPRVIVCIFPDQLKDSENGRTERWRWLRNGPVVVIYPFAASLR